MSSFPLNTGINSLRNLNYRPDIQLKSFIEPFTMVRLYCSISSIRTPSRVENYTICSWNPVKTKIGDCITHTCPLIPKTSVKRPNVLKRSSEPTVKISKANKIGLEDLHSTLKLWPHSFVHPYKPVKTS